jgi:4-hydroxy-tetrahydrodipicolinate reductase
MVNGLPGNVARIVARYIAKDPGFELLPYSLTGPEIEEPQFTLDDRSLELIRPEIKEQRFEAIMADQGPFLSVDFTHPSAVNPNAEFYCRSGLPFVMGTTGGDRTRLEETVTASSIAAVIAPNMAKQIVGFQAMMEYAAETFPNLFDGYTLEIKESHQQGKADTSGTAKAMVTYFNRLGIPYETDQIVKVRDPEIQQQLGIGKEHLDGHGWHTYTLTSADGTARFEFTHNINGREIYGQGTLDALQFLSAKVQAGVTGKVFSMIDVLKDG